MVNEIAINQATMTNDTNGVFALGLFFLLIVISVWVMERKGK